MVTTCDGTATLAADAPAVDYPDAVGTWSVISGTGASFSSTEDVTTINTNTVSIYNIPAGGATFQWYVGRGTIQENGEYKCHDAQTITIKNFNVPAEVTSVNQTICGTQTAKLEAKSISGYADAEGTWECVNSTASDMTKEQITALIDSPHSNTAFVSGLPVGTHQFQWSVSNGVCNIVATDLATVVNGTASALAYQGYENNATITVCAPEFELDATPASDGYIGTWTVDGGTIADSDINNPKAKVTGIANDGYALLTWKITKTDDLEGKAPTTARLRVLLLSATILL
jgi:hypothetical protein